MEGGCGTGVVLGRSLLCSFKPKGVSLGLWVDTPPTQEGERVVKGVGRDVTRHRFLPPVEGIVLPNSCPDR